MIIVIQTGGNLFGLLCSKVDKQTFIYCSVYRSIMKQEEFICRLCGKNNGGEFAVGICELCANMALVDMVAG